MPSFYQGAVASQHPLTPPDSGSGYRYRSMHYAPEQYGSMTSMSQPRHEASYEYQPYMQPAVAPAPPPYQYSQSSYQHPNSLPPIQNYYEPMGAPILPPLRIQDHVSFGDDYQRRLHHEQEAAREQQQHAQKEEKPTGGVSAKLDYDMDRMTDFVTMATEQIFDHRMQSPPSFRKWVHQVLSATRLPSATILLSLHYLNDRVAQFPSTVQSGENYIYRLLAVSLILGSKFLDDNTFINRSWSDVTAIKVTELNMLEMKWLHLIEYRLHVDFSPSSGLQAWLDSWHKYDAVETTKLQQSARPSPIDTGAYRHSAHRERYSPYPSPYESTSSRSYDTPSSARSMQYGDFRYNPSSCRDAADDMYSRQHNHLYVEETQRRVTEERVRQAAYAYSQPAPAPAPSSYYQMPSYSSNWDQHWGTSNAHPYDCGCSSCVYGHHYRPHFMASSYQAQSVMG